MTFIKKVIMFLMLFVHSIIGQSFAENYDDDAYFDSYIMLKLTSRGYILERHLSAYDLNDGLYVSLQEFARSVYFRIDVLPEEKRAEGRFQKEKFYLDHAAHEFFAAGKDYKDDLKFIKFIDGDIFIADHLLTKIFDIHLHLNMRMLSVDLESKKDLPVHLEIAFEKRKMAFQSEKTSANASDTKTKPNAKTMAYGLYGTPSLTLQTDTHFSHQKATKEDQISGGYTLTGHNDLLFFESDYSLSGHDRRGVTAASLRMQRENDFGGILGDIDTSYVAIGDISAPSIPLVGGAGQGRGVHLTNQNRDQATSANGYVIEGHADANTEIELYRNDILVALGASDHNGRFIFTDLSLDTGVNIFRIVKYGAFGDISSETRRVTLGTNIKKGELQYHLYAGQSGQNLFDSLVSPHKEDSQNISWSSHMDYGITDTMSMNMGIVRNSLFGREDIHATFGTKFSALYGGFYDIGIASRSDGAGFTNLFTGYNFNAVNISLQRQDYFGFQPYENNQESSSSISLSSAFEPFNNISFSANISAQRDVFLQNYIFDSLSLRTRIGLQHFSVENDLFQLHDHMQNTTTQYGETRFHSSYGSHLLRNYLTYDLTDDFIAKSTRLAYQYHLGQGTSLGIDVIHDFSTEADRYSGRITWPEKYFTANLGVTGDNDGNYGIGLSMRFAFAQDAENQNFNITPIKQSGRASPVIFAYYDANHNNIFDGTEQKIPYAEFKARGNITTKANKDGNAVLAGLLSGMDTEIRVITPSLGNIYFKPTEKKYFYKPRTGAGGYIAIPILISGGAEGMIPPPLKKDHIALYHAKTKKFIRNIPCEKDGYFIAENLLQGDYYLSWNNQSHFFTINRDDPFISDIIFSDN